MISMARTLSEEREDYKLLNVCPDGKNEPLIILEGVTLRIGSEMLLPGTSWEIRTGENWAILGPNGSGKSALARAIKGDVPHVRGKLIRHGLEARGERIGYVSCELQEQILFREDRLEEARFQRQRARTHGGALLLENMGIGSPLTAWWTP